MTKSRDRGAVTVEFALIVPLFLLLVLAIIEFGIRYQNGAQINNAAFIAARKMSIPSATPGNDRQAAKDASASALPDRATAPAYTILVNGDAAMTCVPVAGVTKIVTVTIADTAASPTKSFGSTFPLSGKGVARCES